MRRTPLSRGDKPLKRTALRQRSTRPSAAARRLADSVWATAVRQVYDGYCVVCGRRATQSHHAYPKVSHPEWRHERWNGVPVCHGCHVQAHALPELMAALQRLAVEQQKAELGARDAVGLAEAVALVARVWAEKWSRAAAVELGELLGGE